MHYLKSNRHDPLDDPLIGPDDDVFDLIGIRFPSTTFELVAIVIHQLQTFDAELETCSVETVNEFQLGPVQMVFKFKFLGRKSCFCDIVKCYFASSELQFARVNSLELV